MQYFRYPVIANTRSAPSQVLAAFSSSVLLSFTSLQTQSAMAQTVHYPNIMQVVANPPKKQKICQNKKPSKCVLGRSARRRLWAHLRQYCDDLFATDLPLTERFDPPQHAVDMFSQLGLRHPRNLRSLRKFYNNFIPKCGHLLENDENQGRKPRQWKAKPNCAGTPQRQPPMLPPSGTMRV